MERASEKILQAPTMSDAAIAIVKGNLVSFIGSAQLHVMRQLCHGEEGDLYRQKFVEFASRTREMPGPYQSQKVDDPLVYLHYFKGSADWFIVEKDESKEQVQCFGLADLFNDGGELGYIPICELIENNVELDLHWTPKPLSEVRKARQS